MSNKLTAVRGDTYELKVTVQNSSGNAVDITGYEFFFTVKTDDADDDSSAIISDDVTSHSDPTNGETTFTISRFDMDISPGTYYYDVQMKDTSNNVTTLLIGEFVVKQDISTRHTAS